MSFYFLDIILYNCRQMKQKFLYILLLPPLVIVAVFLYFSLTSPPNTSSKVLSLDTSNTSTPTLTPSPSPPVRLLFTGDTMFDRSIRSVGEKKDYSFVLEEITEYLNSFDLVITNLEGPISDNQSQSKDSEIGSTDNYVFTFNPQIIATLKENNLELLNLGNNHILNFGKEGLQQTIDYLKEDGLKYFGDTGTELVSPFIFQNINGLEIVFINYNQFTDQGIDSTLELLSRLDSQADLIILYTHWGDEYQEEPSDTIKSQAYQFIDQGADLIIGSHPHVVQTHELYNGKNIYYSLGNFIFDQYFSEETQQGLLVEVKIEKGYQGEIKLTTKEVFVDMQTNGQTVLRNENL